MPAAGSGLFGGLDGRDEGHQEDLEVEPQRPVVDVVVVELDAIGDRTLTSQALDLRQARDPGADAVTLGVAGQVRLEHLHVLRALRARADEAHLTTGDVEELWQLVERCSPQPPADAGAAADALAPAGRPTIEGNEGGRRRLLDHRAELQDVERPTVATDAALAEKH